jgi:N-acetyl-gamma-glutamyl-phosphate reductase
VRGILVTAYAEKKQGVSARAVREAFQEEYKDDPFVRILPAGAFPQTKNVAYTNFCDIGIWADDASSRIIVISAIDNLVKGASGQAVQNMNLCCGFPEDRGLV